jgi:hypothetical protein
VFGKEVEIIMAFRQIVGVSCDGHTNKLREAIALILVGKTYKPDKKLVEGGKVGKKGMRELVNLFSSVNYEGGSGNVSCSREKGRENRITL